MKHITLSDSNVVIGNFLDVASLKLLDTTSASTYPQSCQSYVEGVGDYYLDRSRSDSESLPAIAVPATGPGRWILRTGDASGVNASNLLKLLGNYTSIVSNNIAIVDPNGSDVTGRAGLGKPFASLGGVKAYFTAQSITSGLVIVNPGSYNLNSVSGNVFVDGFNYYFHQGAILTKSTGFLHEGNLRFNIYGYVTINLSGTSGFVIDADTAVNSTIEFASINITDFGYGFVFTDSNGSLRLKGKLPESAFTVEYNIITTTGSTSGRILKMTVQDCYLVKKYTVDNAFMLFSIDLPNVNSFLKIERCKIDQPSTHRTIQSNNASVIIYSSVMVTNSDYVVYAPIFYYDNNVLSNKDVSATTLIGPAGGITVNVAIDKIF